MGSSRQTRFLVLEGMDGTGTTTIAADLADALRARDLRVCVTAEPTDGPFGRVLRRHLEGELHLDAFTTTLVFSADRADHLTRTIRPALARGEWVVCDRYLLSTLAYQGAEGVPHDAILAASSSFDVPDLTVVLEVPDDVREARMAGRDGRDRYEDPALADALRASYAGSVELLRGAGHTIDVLDADAPRDALVAAILRRLDTL
jgi:dTMP kinase